MCLSHILKLITVLFLLILVLRSLSILIIAKFVNLVCVMLILSQFFMYNIDKKYLLQVAEFIGITTPT